MDSPSRISRKKVLALILGLLVVAVVAAYAVVSSGILEEKIDAFNYIKALPTSQRKTLLFSAFVKQKKKAVSREINQMGFLI